MSLFLGILTFVVILAVLILAHELGHFTLAKLFGVRVDEFALGFPPRIKGWWRGGTLYSINAIPIGGYVKMAGENGEDLEPDSFGAKPPWQRFLVLLAGPFMNLLLAVAIFFVTFVVGFPDGLPVITAVSPHSPAAGTGLQAGDRILAVNGVRVSYRSDLQGAILTHVGQRISLRVQRGGGVFTLRLVPRRNPPAHQGPLGVTLGEDTTVRYGAGTALDKSVTEVGGMVLALPATLGSIPRHGTQDVAGPIGIAHITTQAVGNAHRDGPSPLFELVALLSASLGILNLLPFPALDGGRIVFVLISWVRRRNLDPEVEGLIHMVGMALLLLLIAVISYQDLARWIGGGSF